MQRDDKLDPLGCKRINVKALKREFEEFRQEVRQRWQREDAEKERARIEVSRHAFQEQYPKWNATNLETEGIAPCRTTSSASLVDKAHPIINLLQHNAAFIGCDISKQPLVKDQYHKISNQVIAACCNTIRMKVLDCPAADVESI
jgi:hypothetical protein